MEIRVRQALIVLRKLRKIQMQYVEILILSIIPTEVLLAALVVLIQIIFMVCNLKFRNHLPLPIHA